MIRNVTSFFENRMLRNLPIKHTCRCCSVGVTEPKKKVKLDHLTRTADQFRQTRMYKATVHRVDDLSETVRSMTVQVAEKGIRFKAGQWVDFYIPNVQEVAGYSMTSPPYIVERDGILDLAVRYSVYPPTYWIHKQSHLGDVITIRVGGEFHYDPKPNTVEATADILLIGGGVGINPMSSIAQQYTYVVNKKLMYDQGVRPGRLKILYSAREFKELVFRDLFLKEKSKCSSISCKFFVTRENSVFPEDTHGGHINTEHLREAITDLQLDNLLCYVCGPSAMIDAMEKELLALGIDRRYIKYEKWW